MNEIKNRSLIVHGKYLFAKRQLDSFLPLMFLNETNTSKNQQIQELSLFGFSTVFAISLL